MPHDFCTYTLCDSVISVKLQLLVLQCSHYDIMSVCTDGDMSY